jgi:hypothetical protein
LPASTAHIATPRDRDDLAVDRLGSEVIHAFIVRRLDDVDRDGQIIRGVTWRTRKDERKYIIVSIAAPDRVLAHELGHFFGLPHSTAAISIMNKRQRKQPSSSTSSPMRPRPPRLPSPSRWVMPRSSSQPRISSASTSSAYC